MRLHCRSDLSDLKDLTSDDADDNDIAVEDDDKQYLWFIVFFLLTEMAL